MIEKDALLINNSADIIGVLDSATLQIKEINNAFTQIIGYTREEVRGMPLTFFLTDEDRCLVNHLIEDEKERFSFETRIDCKDRKIKWLQWEVLVKEVKWFVNARDTTDMKETEKIRNYLATIVKSEAIINKIKNGEKLEGLKAKGY